MNHVCYFFTILVCDIENPNSMNKWLLVMLLAVLFGSCQSDNFDVDREKQGEISTFLMTVDHAPQTYLVREIKDYYSSAVLNQIVDRLVVLDPKTLEPTGSLAEKWTLSNDGLTYTFFLRKDVYFHDHSCFSGGKGRLFTAQDVKFSFELLCKPNESGTASHGYTSLFKESVEGAAEFFKGADKISGLKVVDDHTVSITLNNKDLNFPAKLSLTNYGIVAKEVVECGKETDLIGTGPFRYGYEGNDGTPFITLLRNDKYYLKDENGRQLPYLDTVIVYLEDNQLEQLEMFEEGRLHFIQNIPPSRIADVLEGRIKDFSGNPPLMKLTNDPLLSTQYYSLNMLSPALKDKRVRQALNYAVNKDKILTYVLKSSPQTGIFGIVPPLKKEFPGYDFDGVRQAGYDYNPEKARELLAQAGYPGGKGFPTLTLKFNLGTIHSAVADEFRKQIAKELNININLEGLTFEERLDDEINARGDIFRTAWYADYKDPESFLMNFYGKSVPKDRNQPSGVNATRFVNAKFDELFERAQSEKSNKVRNELFAQAEKILLEEAPLIVLWYNEQFILQYYKVRNLETNSILYLDLKRVRIKDWTPEEYEARAKK
jgi:oligopeptide transport system substrate-binding protein